MASEDVPQIKHAKAIGKRWDLDGVIILSFTKDKRIGAVSYGRDRQRCTAFGKILDGLVEQFISGDIVTPE